MGFDREALAAALARHGPLARVLVAETRGSAPRGPGTAMLVWGSGQEGTIGGGTLELEATRRARQALAAWMLGGAPSPPPARIDRMPLGPALNQCCGGAVTLVTEIVTPAHLQALAPEGAQGQGLVIRALALQPSADHALAAPLPEPPPEPLAMRRLRARARDRGQGLSAPLLQGHWLAEPLRPPGMALWIWGAGHVGRALMAVLEPLPGIAPVWLDSGPERFPQPEIHPCPPRLWHEDPSQLIPQAPRDAHHLVLTYSHALDLALCHGISLHGHASLGLIGSATKWARFRRRLADLGLTDAQISRIACPIGDPTLGKHPQAIAIGVAAALLKARSAETCLESRTGVWG